MENQPYDVVCCECGSTLIIKRKAVDSDLDISLEIYPCEVCMKEGEE